MRKFVVGLCCLGLMAFNSLAAAVAPQVIPYPAGLVTDREGASSAPREINHKVSAYYKAQDFYAMRSGGSLTIVPNFPTYQQTTEYTCGPAAALMLLTYYGKTQYTEMELAQKMHTQGYPIGTSAGNVVAFFREIGWQVESNLTRPPFKDTAEFQSFVRQQLRLGHPILVENVDWGGHWRVIIGYDTMGTGNSLDDVLILADSYDTADHAQDGYVVQNMEKFFATWFDHSMLPEKERQQPFVLAYPAK